MAKKDVIIGGASNYDWNDLRNWVTSIKDSGFDGDVIIVGTNMTKETQNRLTREGVILSLYGKVQENGDVIQHHNGVPHVERFFYIWNALSKLNPDDYYNVITTDTRDVIFQENPSTWLLNAGDPRLVCSSEGMRYKNEPWGNQNLLDTFGPFFHERMKERFIYNVGIIAGDFWYVRDMLLHLFQLSINRPVPIVDQAVYNFIIDNQAYHIDALMTTNSDHWAIQLGTTLEAVKAGKGDLGYLYRSNQEAYIYEDNQPEFTDDGCVVDSVDKKKYTIVHQYDRVPFLKEKIDARYADVG